MGVRLARFCFIARWATALAIGSSVAHAEIERSANLNKGSAAFKRTVAVPICVAQLAYQEGKIMNENEIIANLNPKLGKFWLGSSERRNIFRSMKKVNPIMRASLRLA